MTNPILKTGSLAYWDTFSGLVPCKVMHIAHPPTPPLFDLLQGGISTSIKVTILITQDHGPYRKGELFEEPAPSVVPREAIRRHQYSQTISRYEIAT